MKAFLALLLLSCSLHAQTAVMLAWDIQPETNVVGYRLLSGPAPRTYTATNLILGRAALTGTVSNVPPGKTFFAVVAFDSAGIDSDYSNEVSWTNKAAGPKGFRLVGTMQASIAPTGPWKDVAKVDVLVPPVPPDVQQFYRTRLLLEETK